MYFAHLDIADIMISPDDFECDRFDMFDMRAMLAAVISLKHITIPSLEKNDHRTGLNQYNSTCTLKRKELLTGPNKQK